MHMTASESAAATGSYTTILCERVDGVAWITLNRPAKRNAMNPTMHYEMSDLLAKLEFDDEVKVLVLTGAGQSWCAGQDLKEFFQATEHDPAERRKAAIAAKDWTWDRLWTFPRP